MQFQTVPLFGSVSGITLYSILVWWSFSAVALIPLNLINYIGYVDPYPNSTSKRTGASFGRIDPKQNRSSASAIIFRLSWARHVATPHGHAQLFTFRIAVATICISKFVSGRVPNWRGIRSYNTPRIGKPSVSLHSGIGEQGCDTHH